MPADTGIKLLVSWHWKIRYDCFWIPLEGKLGKVKLAFFQNISLSEGPSKKNNLKMRLQNLFFESNKSWKLRVWQIFDWEIQTRVKWKYVKIPNFQQIYRCTFHITCTILSVALKWKTKVSYSLSRCTQIISLHFRSLCCVSSLRSRHFSVKLILQKHEKVF